MIKVRKGITICKKFYLIFIFIFNSIWYGFAESLIADEFSSELADGVAYVSGYDDDSRPVLVIFL